MAKKGDRYECGTCGVVVVVEDGCGCSECDVICCGAPMKPVKTATKAAPSKTAAKK